MCSIGIGLAIVGGVFSLIGGMQQARAAQQQANFQAAPILSLDVPSGVDATTGSVYDPAARAAATLTLALPKQGLRADTARECVGELYLADISVPPALYSRPPLGLEVGSLFAVDDTLRLW